MIDYSGIWFDLVDMWRRAIGAANDASFRGDSYRFNRYMDFAAQCLAFEEDIFLLLEGA